MMSEQSPAQVSPRAFGSLWPFLKITFSLYIVAEILLSYSNFLAFEFFRKFQNGEFSGQGILEQEAIKTDLHQSIFGLLYLITFFLSIIAYSRFQFRAMKNLHIIDAAGVVTSPGWSIGYFFVPIVFLWKPFGAVCQIWRGTFDPDNGEAKVPAIIGWWWAFWITANLIGNISFRMLVAAGGLDEEVTNFDLYMGSLVLDIVSSVLLIPAALMVLNFYRRIRDEQEANIINRPQN